MSNARELAELGGSYGTGGFVGMKNRIINGAMVIDQRNAGSMVSITTGETYSVDRWFARFNAGSFTATQGQSTVAPTGFKNSFLVNVTTGGTISAATRGTVLQRVEGYNWADMGYGAAGASTCTLSFWVRSSLTGTFSGGLSNSAGDRSYVFTYTISAANTWEFKTVVVAGDTSGTWVGATNGIGMSVSWDLGNGSDLKTSTTGSWLAGDYRGATGSVAPLGTSGATWYITGVQFEKGSTATSFDYRPYGTELQLCQRYYERFTGISSGPYRTGYGYNTSIYMSLPFQVTKRTTGGSFSSSASGTTLLSAYGNGSSSGFLGGLMTGSINFNTPELTTMTMYQNLTASTYSPYGTAILWTLNNNQWVDYSAEL